MEQIAIKDVLRELDHFFINNNTDGARLHMLHWLEKAAEQKDWKSEFTILNELIGFYRKIGDETNGMLAIQRLKILVKDHNLSNDVSGATAYMNMATALRAFQKTEDAKYCFDMTEKIYKGAIEDTDYRYASYYNNVALLHCDKKEFSIAGEYYIKALNILKLYQDAEGEEATTCVSLACMYHAMDLDAKEKKEKIEPYLERAKEILNRGDSLPNSYLAYVASVCGKSFWELGYTEDGIHLMKRSEAFYNQHR